MLRFPAGKSPPAPGAGPGLAPVVAPALAPAVALIDGASIDEQTLVERVAGSDRVAFEALYRRYFPRLTRFVGRMIHRPHLIGEIVNDTMLVVWRKAASYNGRSKVSTWIFSIAYRTALHAVRRMDDPVDAEAPESAAPAEAQPDRELMLRQDRRILDAALRELSIEHRAVVELTYYHDCGCREIAQVLGCPVDTVKTRLFYARRRLRALLDDRKEDLR